MGDNIKEVLKFAGAKDVWSKTQGNTGSTLDFVTSAIDALAATNNVRVSDDILNKLEEKK